MRKNETILILFDAMGMRGGRLGCFRAHFKDEPGRHDAGGTPEEALGNLALSHPEHFIESGAASKAAGVQGSSWFDKLDDAFKIFCASSLGRLIELYPDVYGVEVVSVGVERWPRPHAPDPVHFLVY